MRYHMEEDPMPNILIRDIPAEDLARLDAKAAHLGLSRQDYLRRQLLQEARVGMMEVTAADFKRFAERFADLGDEEIMRKAWE